MPPLRYPVPRMTPVRHLADLAIQGQDHRGWYAYAGDQIATVAPVLGCDSGRVCDMLALFSPRVSVSRSAVWATTYIREGRFMADCTRGHRAAVEHYERTGEIRGPKTGPFARALRGDPNAVVLDTWMGVALMPDTNPGRFEVRAVWDRAAMMEDGRICLYLTHEPFGLPSSGFRDGKVTNWPGSLKFPCRVKRGTHNMARVRYDCWFTGPDGFTWHGYSIGDNTQITHCRRTKHKPNGVLP